MREVKLWLVVEILAGTDGLGGKYGMRKKDGLRMNLGKNQHLQKIELAMRSGMAARTPVKVSRLQGPYCRSSNISLWNSVICS